MDLQCPECHSRVKLDVRAPKDGLRSVTCPSCNKSFDARAQMARANGPGATTGTISAVPSDVTVPATAAAVKAPAAAVATAAPTPGAARAGASGASGSGEKRRFPDKLGPYQVLEELNRGGMGIVYKALDPVLRRHVAIKVLLAGEGATDEDVKRFQREAQASARLHHPNIVLIHATGEYQGKPYFVMDFVEGMTVKQLLETGKISPRLALQITEQAAEALDHAARQGVIHRDVKPANVIVDKDGHARIMDFGLARRVDEDMQITQSGTTMGTPSYMAPEQAEGKLADVDAQSDIYSLGAVLYEMLTGQPPFDGNSTMAVLRKVLDEDPVPPRTINPKVHRDIETICLKCLEKDKIRRYKTGRDLFEDIRRFNAGEPISAAPLSVGARFWKRARKHWQISLSACIAFLAVVGVLGYGLMQSAAQRRAASVQKDLELKDLVSKGSESLDKAKRMGVELSRASYQDFDQVAENLRKQLKEATGYYQQAQLLVPESFEAKAGLEELTKVTDVLDTERLVFIAKRFQRPQLFGQVGVPPNPQAALAFCDLALEKDPTHAMARELRKEALGIRAVTIASTPPDVDVYIRPFADAQGKPVAPTPDEHLGRSPIRDREMEPGRYVVTFRRQGFEMQEATLQVGPNSEPALRIEINATPKNMVLIAEGPVWMQETSDSSEKVPAFYIDRYEYPNVAGRQPAVNVSSVMQAADTCRTQGKTLCSPYQWLRACMGDDRRDYPYGKDYLGGACSAGYDPSVQKEAFPNGWFPACRTAQGIYDMSGNVSEWTALDEDTGFLYGGDVFTGVERPKLQLSCQRSRKRMEASNTAVAGLRCCKAVK